MRWKVEASILVLILKFVFLVFSTVVYKCCIDKCFTKSAVSTYFHKAAMFKGFLYSFKYKYVYMIIN